MGEDQSIRLIGRALDILRTINLQGAPTLAEIASTLELPYPTALRIVRALIAEGVIEREPVRKRYRVTALVQALSYGFQSDGQLADRARGPIRTLTEKVHWPISVVTRVGNVMVVRESTSTQTPMTFNHYFPGFQVPLIQSASGQAYLAHAGQTASDSLIAHLKATGTDADLRMLGHFERSGDIERIRSQGYAAVARTAYSANPGRTSSFAVPIFAGDDLLGTLTLVFFASAMSLEDAVARYLPDLKHAAQTIGSDMLCPDEVAGTLEIRSGHAQ